VLKHYRYLLTILFFITAFSSSGQDGMDTLSTAIRPRIGLGVGTMTYYGEVQNYQKGFVPMVNRYYGTAYVNAPLTKYFNIEFSAGYGKIAANERTLVKNLNFESRIRIASVHLYYNLYPLFTSRRGLFHPYVGVGFSSFEFLSKTDMYDANGNQYHYWSDGSIMDMEESDPLAATNATELFRDYTYETDLREQNLDSLGDYKEQSFAIPLTLGMEWHLSPRWDFRVASTFHLTFTDLIDNITDAGVGPIRHGDSKKDKLWTTYVSLSYDLQFPKEKAFDPMDDSGIEYYADFEQNDTDQDGVIDAYDECVNTPLEALVDEKGCPMDRDGDGVPDYRDDEPDTPEGNWVDEYGVTLTEEDIAKHWREFNDSTGYDHDFVEERMVVEFGHTGQPTLKDPYANKKEKSYVIIIGKEHKDVDANTLHEYLGYNDFKTEMRGDTVYYILGEYSNLEDAVSISNQMKDKGIPVELIAREGAKDSTFIPIDEAVIEKIDQIQEKDGTDLPVFAPESQVFRVQIGAFKNKVDESKAFPGVGQITHVTGKDGITRYYSGNYSDYKEANAYRKKLIGKGYRSAFVVAYQGTERKTLKQLGIDPNELPDNYNEQSELTTFTQEDKDHQSDGGNTTDSNIVNGIDMTKVKYRVKLAYYAGDIPVEDVDIFYNIGGVKGVKGLDGSTTYYSKVFKSQAEATNAIEDYKTYGLSDLSPIVEYNGEYFTVEEFDAKLKP
jgi:hypothetical protein